MVRVFFGLLITCFVFPFFITSGNANLGGNSHILSKLELQQAIESTERDLKDNGAKYVIDKYSDSVVLIRTISNQAEDDGMVYNSAVRKRLKKHHYKYGVTSGVILSKDGVICTTYSGIMGSDEYIVSVRSELAETSSQKYISLGRDDYKARLIKEIPELNLAFLKIDSKNSEVFHNVELGNDAYLINNPDSMILNGAVAIGKARGENFVDEVKPMNSSNRFALYVSGIERLIFRKLSGKSVLVAENPLTNSGIIPENDGGAVLDMQGKLLGIASVDNEDFSFTSSQAIPVSIVKQAIKIAIPRLLKLSNVADLGINVVTPPKEVLSSIPESLRKTLSIPEKIKNVGVLVKSVDLKSSGDGAGVQSGDLILGFNKDLVTDVKTYENLEKASIGEQTVNLKVLRGKKLLEFEVFR